MTQQEQLLFLIQYLQGESDEYCRLEIPESLRDQKRLLRSLMNVRPPLPVSEAFRKVQDDYLSGETRRKGVIFPADLSPVQKGIYLWQGDITRLAADAIVNAANSALLGCFIPCHGCIDNAIHSAAGAGLRLSCHALMQQQDCAEPTGSAKITEGGNLPCRYVIHTVGPIISGRLTPADCALLASCYRSCLELADSCGLESIAFCCISTGEFRFPNRAAAKIALQSVRKYRRDTDSRIEVIFNVFKDKDYEIYRELLAADKTAD